MDSQTCTAAVVTPYPSPASQAQSRANSRPQSSRCPSPHPHNRLPQPNPAFPVDSCSAPALHHPNSRQTLTNAHTTLMNTHPCRPSLITAHHPNHSNCSADNLTQTLVKRSQTLTNTRKRSPNTHASVQLPFPQFPAVSLPQNLALLPSIHRVVVCAIK